MSNLIQDAKEQISSILNRACEKAVGKGELPAGAVLSGSVEIPKDTANGDYAAPVCVVTERTRPSSTPISMTSACLTRRFSCNSSVCFITS